jgi:Protein of unknown function (DUF1569)
VKSMWTDAREIKDRIARVQPGATPQWGRFSSPQMICHLADSLKMALGDLPVPSKWLPIRYPPLKQFIIFVAPFPKHAPTAPQLLARRPREWAADVADLQTHVDRLGQHRASRAPWPEHPVFGPMSERAWGVQIYRHMDHHLKQFGV